MTLEELITLYRAEAFDAVAPFFCSDELLTIYANEAQDEACRRGTLLLDSRSPMVQVAFAAGATEVPIDPHIVDIKRVRVDGQPATALTLDEMDERFPGWQADSAYSRPTHLVSGLSTGFAALWPRPAQDGVIAFTAQRLPLKRLANDTDKPEIRLELHRGLVDWMLHRVFGIQDSELYNPQKAAVALGKFEAEFGQKASGRNEAWVRVGDKDLPAPIA